MKLDSSFCALLFITKITSGHKCFSYLKRLLPKEQVKQLDWLLTLRCRFVKHSCLKDFLEKCLKHGIYTKKLKEAARSRKLVASPAVCNDLLSAELTSVNETLSKLKDAMNQILPLMYSLRVFPLMKFVKMMKTMTDRTRQTCRERYQRLLQACAPVFPTDLDDRIVNLSSQPLTLIEKQALCLGLDFAIPPRRAKQIAIDAEFENMFHQLAAFPLPADQLPLLRSQLVTLSKTYGHSKIERSCLLPCHVEALTKLKQNPDLVLLRPDKGSGVVVMDTADYHRRFDPILSDPTKFKIDSHQEDGSTKATKSIAKLLNDLKQNNVITPDQHKRLLPQATVPPRMYGLPKTHKDGVPVRPIVSMTGSAYERVSKWLATLLKPIEKAFTTRCVDDSFTFVDQLSTLAAPNSVLVSFDVSSLFTNVPVSETIDIIIDEVKRAPGLCPIPPDSLRSLLLFCTHNVQFLFNGTYYRQIDGVAMGSALGPLFANIFMGHIERLLSPEIDSTCLFYTRYVDDTFAIVNDHNESSKLLSIFNSIHPNLHFTTELESDCSLSFLDVLIHRRSDGSFSFSIFRKKTWTGVYLNFHSFVPMSYKRALVRSLFTRVVRLCSPEHLQNELDFVHASLLRNAYPSHFIDKHKVTEPYQKPIELTVPKKSIFLQVPFYGDKSASSLKNSVSALFSRYFPAAQPFILFRTTSIPARSPKDRLPVACSSSLVYKFSCDCGAVYYGRTSRRLEVRVREHVPKLLMDGGRTVVPLLLLMP